MVEETSDTMNLDLNLGPVPEPVAGSVANERMNLDDWNEEPLHRISEAAVRVRTRQRWRWRQVHISPETQNISVDINHLLDNHGGDKISISHEAAAAHVSDPSSQQRTR